MSPYSQRTPSEVSENSCKNKVHALNDFRYNKVFTKTLLWTFIYRNKCIDISLNL